VLAVRRLVPLRVEPVEPITKAVPVRGPEAEGGEVESEDPRVVRQIDGFGREEGALEHRSRARSGPADGRAEARSAPPAERSDRRGLTGIERREASVVPKNIDPSCARKAAGVLKLSSGSPSIVS
jgi:hypothetical protein